MDAPFLAPPPPHPHSAELPFLKSALRAWGHPGLPAGPSSRFPAGMEGIDALRTPAD